MDIAAADGGHVEGIRGILDREIALGTAHFGERPTRAGEVEAWIAASDRLPLLVAIAGSREVEGFARAALHKPREAYRWTVDVSVYVRPESQGRGVGRALYERLFPEVTALGYRAVVAGIALPNPASVRLHESMGMRHVGTFERVGFKHGRWIDVGYWMLNIGDGAPSDAAGSV